jgi:uncharacterized protein
MTLDSLRSKILVISSWTVLAFGCSGIADPAMAGDPSFACDKVQAGSIKGMVCQDSNLSALDRKLAAVYQAAAAKVTDGQRSMLRTEQRGWIKGRDECWKSADKHSCIVHEYQHRIAFLQARYRLIPGTGPISYFCANKPGNDIIVTYYATDPPTLIARYRNSTSLMFLQVAASGAKYQGRNETFWEHHGEALVTWGYGALEMHCKTTAGAQSQTTPHE